MAWLTFAKANGPSGFGYNSTAEQVTQGIDLSGKTFLLTGCNAGLGLETLRVIALRGGHVIAAARTLEKARAAVGAIAGEATPMACELSEPASVRECAAAVKSLGRPLDAIICNAGIMALPKLQRKHGYELQFLTNHMGHFILVTELLDQLAPDGRVVMVSSAAHRRTPAGGIQFDNLDGAQGYAPFGFYGQSKLANLLFARQLAKKFAGTQRTANSLHPGVIATELARSMNPVMRMAFKSMAPLMLKTAAQGAATQCYVATHPTLATVSGSYFADSNPATASRHGTDDSLAERLWRVSGEIAAKLD